MSIRPGQKGAGVAKDVDRLELDARGSRGDIALAKAGALLARAVGAEARVGHDRVMSIDPIYAEGVVADALRLPDCRCLSHWGLYLKQVREARAPRQAGARRWLLGGLAAAVVLLVGPGPRVSLAIAPGEAAQHLGQAVSIEGFVQKVMCSPRACLMSFEAGWSGLVATIPSGFIERFGDPKKYEGQNVRIRGVVEDRQGKPRLELTDPSRIQIVTKGKPAAGSQVLEAKAQPAVRTDGSGVQAQPPPKSRSQVQVSGAVASGSAAASLGSVVRGLQEEAAVSGTGGGDRASELAVQGLRERAAIQSHTIETLEAQLEQVNGRLQELEARPAPTEEQVSLDGVPPLERWVVPARRGFEHPKPRTGWSTKRLVRELGSPSEVQTLTRDTALWIYGREQFVTVKRERVVSASGF